MAAKAQHRHCMSDGVHIRLEESSRHFLHTLYPSMLEKHAGCIYTMVEQDLIPTKFGEKNVVEVSDIAKFESA